jgi:membrane protease YdiL (CAAX protease family)
MIEQGCVREGVPQNNNTPGRTARTILRDPILWTFIILAAAGTLVSIIYSGEWLPSLSLIAGLALAGVLIWLFTRKFNTPSPVITGKAQECWILLAYYLLFLILSFITRGEGIFANEFSKWIWFVILPFVLLWAINVRRASIKDIFRSLGFRRQGLGKGLLLGLVSYLVVLPFTFFFLPEAQLQKLQEIFQEPVRALILIPICLVFSLATAAFTEEFFFRGMLQSRLSRLIGSELRSCLIIAFLFGIYHLPYAYFSASWPTHGNFPWAISNVLAEQMITGVVLGMLWMRTHNIAAPVLFHALVNVLAIMSMLNINFS